MIIVLTLSKTILVVAEISFVTLIPAKLKNAMEIIVPKKRVVLLLYYLSVSTRYEESCYFYVTGTTYSYYKAVTGCFY